MTICGIQFMEKKSKKHIYRCDKKAKYYSILLDGTPE
jgi:hypothetical protein